MDEYQRTRTGSDSKTDFVHLDDLFELLSNRRRRVALKYVITCEGPVSLEEVAAHVARTESEGREHILDGEHDRIHASLYHTHVPKLVEWTVLEFDSESDVVRLGDNSGLVERCLELVDSYKSVG